MLKPTVRAWTRVAALTLVCAPAALSQEPQWRMPPMPSAMPMLPSIANSTPKASPYLPFSDLDPATLPPAGPRRIVALDHGDTLRLIAAPVHKRLRQRDVVMYGFNGQIPGPLIRVERGSEIVVEFTNRIDLPSSIHWHGVRVDNRFDGVPGVTQDPVAPGETFVYVVRFPDAGIYWYHPHHREDVQQDLGLYGNMLVDAPDPGYYNPVNDEEVVTLDDLLIDTGGVFPYGLEGATHTLMGRFGNTFLLDGEPSYERSFGTGAVVRFFLTNVANTRMFNLDFGGAPIKLVGSDLGRFERETWVDSIVIAPAQRYVVEVRFDTPGRHAITNRIQAIDHFWGKFFPHVDTLGLIDIADPPADPDHGASFATLRDNPRVSEDIQRYREHFDRAPDHELVLTMRPRNLNQTLVQIMALDTLYFPPVEWNDVMPTMNYLSSTVDVEWILRDRASGLENMDIDWRFAVGDVVKIRLHNERRAFHPMQHPIHLHGQRFLLLARDGVAVENRVWKDTVVLPVGAAFDLLVEASNPGQWMLHCHIAEHLEAGMKMVFTVTEPP